MEGTKYIRRDQIRHKIGLARAESWADSQKAPTQSTRGDVFFLNKKCKNKKKILIHLCCSRLSHKADVNVSSAFKCRLPNVSAHSAHVVGPRRAYYHKAGTILLATSSWVMHGRHVSGNEHDQQPGRMQRLIKKQLLKQMLHSVFFLTEDKHPARLLVSSWWDVHQQLWSFDITRHKWVV